MLFSLALILILGVIASYLFKKINMPSLIGYIFIGIILGPYCLNVLDSSLLDISSTLRNIALVIILTRAGLTLKITDLKKIGISAILMSFVPALMEILGFVLLSRSLLDISINEALIMGSIIAAVSPAVIVPRMIDLINNNYGTLKGIPQLILAGSSVDDVVVLVLFTSFLSLENANSFDILALIQIPLSIILGIIIGCIIGFIIDKIFRMININTISQLLVVLSISFILKYAEDYFVFSGLIAIMALSITLKYLNTAITDKLQSNYNNLWSVFEIFLFVLVGAMVNISYAFKAGINVILIIIGSLLFRMIGVFICLLTTKFNKKEKIFCFIAYMPKATVQAAIGAIPLSIGLSCGDLALTIAVCSILLSAPVGAYLIDHLYDKLLTHDI
ncbi:MAG: cation:proton antiporter [Firmicutes bacterium]|nr:cation:proton antiporter [Bacillota bacterium]MDY5997578.1 cation:proton antiporter [Erysipelotrichaceae bacterium]